MPQRRSQKSEGFTVNFATISAIGTALSVVAGFCIWTVATTSDIATKPWVQRGLEVVTLQAKEREKAILDAAMAHSDRNHDDMVSRMKDLSSDTKAQSVKVDMVLETVRELSKERRK